MKLGNNIQTYTLILCHLLSNGTYEKAICGIEISLSSFIYVRIWN